MQRHFFTALALVALSFGALAQPASNQNDTVKPGDNLVLENIPPVPTSIDEQTRRYGDFRTAAHLDWHPQRHEMLISTRFADVPQVHWVKTPGGERRQMTFYPDRVLGAQFEPGGRYFVFAKDVGGGEWFQFYRFDVQSGEITLLTDGKSRNTGMVFAHEGTRIAYSSTRRTGADNDLWVMDTADPKTDKLLTQLQGGGWDPADWSHDGKQILLVEGKSINESNLWLVDVASGEKKQITANQTSENQVSYDNARFSRDGRGIYVSTDFDSEFHRLAYFDLATMKPKFLTTDIKWDVEEFDVSEDGKTLAFVTNENGIGKLYLMDTATGKYRSVTALPIAIITGAKLHRDGRVVAVNVTSAKSPTDVYSVDVASRKVERWTESETGGLNASNFVEAQLVKWKTFDGKEISGFLYQPDAKKFPGKRPVIINIHGGPEGQIRPGYLGRNNYYLNEMGVALIFPNVRGSTGYGKTFTKLDNGFKREDTYKDIGALFDWIGTQPALDASHVMVTGGSYGGHMTWAVTAYYNDKIRCSLPIVGMSNLVTFLEHTEAYRRDLRRVEYGDERDPKMHEYLEKIAPMNHLDAMHKPIFAVVGKNDPRVPWTESRQILDKLNAQGTPTWFLMANDEGHGYAKKKNQDFQFDATVMFVNSCLLEK
ncbi:peptidase S9, prolyl oligopeptidase [Candidatus Koribacter versatilis Ellin345]|uniref:Peptidase S9, prolyl oligopeptidase n=1 Tax=Koribacter versatilis (strain Ellin345) TaxID=204669 RepID=Q1IQN4_KORVE|nr:prolyl oligopeptidase family serine peptidase [Candidatus Koribacter versatilis]ABF40816.1 peptidase S9, prolyl oligopeptidase [Candidatus Koribacter versatilis Ellin345]